MQIDSPYVWFADGLNQNFYRYHAGTQEARLFGFRLPKHSNYALQFQYDRDLLWMQRPGQLALFDTKTSALHQYPLKNSGGFLKMLLDDCHVYLLFKDRLEVLDKETFMRNCPVLDAQQYDGQWDAFKYAVDSSGIHNDSNLQSVLAKLKYLQQRYAGVEHLEIRRHLKQLDVSAFSGVSLRFPDGYEACYQNTELPLAYRQGCLYALMKEYTLRADFRKTLALDRRYRDLFGAPGKDNHGYRMNIDSVHRHVQRVDSLERLGLAPDSLAYFKAASLFTVCHTDWFSGEACYHYGLVHKALQAFLKTWPQSRLADNAEYDLWSTSYCGEGGFDDGVTMEIIERYKQILIRYPDSDLGPEIDYQVFSMLAYLNEPDAEAAKKAGQEYLRRYPNDVRATYVRQELGLGKY
ncbi:MAG: hypothetical protein IPH12_02365 [Saprospirales bacterium]|nr:hypothetical protein [Saprospirales bacterium]